MPDLDKMVAAIKEFDWSDYGLDDVAEVESDEWCYALAAHIYAQTEGQS
jgi:hypothetical protein